MNAIPRILLVDDDSQIRSSVSQYLRANHCHVVAATDGRDMHRVMAQEHFDLVVVEARLPDKDGFEICRHFSRGRRVPHILVSTCNEDADRIVGLELGADDFLTKPFDPRELLARIRAVLRRTLCNVSAIPGEPRRRFLFRSFELDEAAHRLTGPDKREMSLTAAEFDLLMVFAARPNQVLSRDELLLATHGRTHALFERSVDILVSRIRSKIEPDPHRPTIIRTIRGHGYQFAPEVTVVS